MDFPFDLNALFPERISVLDNNLSAGRKAHGRPDPVLQISTVIDELGKASSKAQQLPAPITSAAKLQANRHHLYLLKDGEQNGGRGVIVGFLKVGYKKLFLLDQRGAHLETEPLCVLDFYVTETLQRHGYGLELFDFMLKHKRVQPEQMAYDRPSPKFLSFLEKHYDLKNSVPQVNNFVVFTGFFHTRSAVQLRKVPPKKPEGEIKPYSLMEREVVREEQRALPWPFVRPAGPPHSPPLLPSSPQSRSLSVGSSPSRAPLRPAAAPGLQQGQTPSSQLNDSCRAKRTRPHPQGQVVSLPTLAAPKKEHLQEQASITSLERKEELQAKVSQNRAEDLRKGGVAGIDRGGGRGGWSWTVGESRYTAQWVRQKQEYRSTRPW
ncbi:alpha-tubulin N-acetyltransferase 1 isoform X1 [Labeo rohita]|uniref:Alpha-tubulin N-acetyltransferase 1 n=1 Tax=Labeo rohita TaxID=84645 RepID=A0A498MLR2_LABRO|nr:alpha-tubulin N-acetyltransferase 1 isoform X3 [Labeo rohita]RXN20304.1 alpha-tubulin N-acetyltransferase 1 isoform X1 [Labeo rohita]